MLFGQRFEEAKSFSQGVAPVKVNKKWGLLNANGIWILPPAYDKVQLLGLDWIQAEVKEVSGIASEDGSILAAVEFHQIKPATSNIFRLENDQKLGYLSNEGQWIWTPKR